LEDRENNLKIKKTNISVVFLNGAGDPDLSGQQFAWKTGRII